MEPDAHDGGDVVELVDVAVLNRVAIEALCGAARRLAAVLLAVGSIGLLWWLWYVWKAVDALSASPGAGGGDVLVFGAGDPTLGDYVTTIGQYWSVLATACLVGAAGFLVRLVAAHVGNAVGVSVADVQVGDPLGGEYGDHD